MPISSESAAGGRSQTTVLPIDDNFGQAPVPPGSSGNGSGTSGELGPVDPSTIPPGTNVITPPDVLPVQGYTPEQLRDYIMRQLGYPTWDVELTQAQVMDQIVDALAEYSRWCPRLRFGTFHLRADVYEYLKGVNLGQGPVQVDFVEPNPVPTEIFYGNLIDPAPLFRTGLDEYDIFLRWRKTWMRITSVQPQWLYDDARQVLMIHNPIERYHLGVTCYTSFTSTVNLPQSGSVWVKKYALETARFLHGEIMSKFSGAIPAPSGQVLLLDQQKRDKAQTRIDALLEQVKGMQTLTPLMID